MKPDPALLQATRCLCLASRRAARTITREFDRALRPHGLRATQFTLLSALSLGGQQSIGDLAELMSADRSTLTRNLAVAEQHGLVRVRVDHVDARSRVAAITARGRHLLKSAMPAWSEVQHGLTRTIGVQGAEALRRLAGGPCLLTASSDPEPDGAKR